MPFNEAWEIAKLIPGWYAEDEARLLYDSALRASRERRIGILEIGCYAGRSTRILAEVAKETKSVLWVIDSFSRNHPLPGVENPETSVREVLARSGCEYVVVKSSVAMLPNHAIRYMVDFIHIDDSHEKDDLAIDRLKILPRLRPHGLVVFHDYGPNFPDVVEFVDSLREEYKEVAIAGHTIVLEKL